MHILKAISISRKLNTNSSPLLVTCEDFKDYVCRYSSSIPPKNLIKDLIAYHFLREWQIKCPDYSLVQIDKELIPFNIIGNFTQPRCFDIPAFGSKFLKNAVMIDDFMGNSDSKTRRKIKNQIDLLKISFFDLWVCNEDRNHNNFNLIINPEKNGNYIYAIDNEMIFNTNFLERDLYHLTQDESLLFTDVTKNMLKNKKKKQEILMRLLTDYPIWVHNCKLKLNHILNNIPESWDLNKTQFSTLLETKLFSDTWIETVKKTFELYFTQSIIK